MSETDDISYLNDYMNNKPKKQSGTQTKPQKIVDDNIVIGIDLGTTNSCVGVWRNNNFEIICDEHGNNTIPSYVGFTMISRYIGLEAKNQKELNPMNVFYEFKRLMGCCMDDESVVNDAPFFSFELVSGENDNNVCVRTDFGKVLTPEELSSIILMKLKNMADKFLNIDVKKTVIAVPAYFNDSQRQATKDAAKIAGLDCIRLIHEPTSAALAYGLLNRSITKQYGEEANVLVYDLGGGTLDVSILTISDGNFEVKVSVGDDHMGGIDFDHEIMTYVLSYFKKKNGYDQDDPLDNMGLFSLHQLKKACENAKKILSTHLKTNIIIKDFYEDKHLAMILTREKLNKICAVLLKKCLSPLHDAFKQINISKSDIHEIIMVGGMTRMPAILENIRTFFDGKEPNCSMNPDEVVAMGSAIQGYLLSHVDDPFSENVTLVDILPLSLGVETMGGLMNVLVKRNTVIPITKKKKFTSDTDYDPSVIIKIFEGERKMTKDNFYVGEFELTGIEPAVRGIPKIEVAFNVDVNGIITVSAEDITEKDKIGSKNSISITGNKGRLKKEQIEIMIADAIEYNLKDKLLQKKKECFYEIDEFTNNVNLNLKDVENYKLKEKDREDLQKQIQYYRDWLIEKKYFERTENEYQTVLKEIELKFGTLILKSIRNNKEVDGVNKVKATTVYGDDDEDLKLDENNFDTNLMEDDDMGISDLDENEKKEIKQMKNELIELANSVYELVNDSITNKQFTKIDKDERLKLTEFLNDVLLWSYTAVKPKKIDFIVKIDEVNNECNKIYEIYKDTLSISNDVGSCYEELEKLIMTIKTSVLCGIFYIGENYKTIINSIFDECLEKILEYKTAIFELDLDDELEKEKNSEKSESNTNNSSDENSDDHIKKSDKEPTTTNQSTIDNRNHLYRQIENYCDNKTKIILDLYKEIENDNSINEIKLPDRLSQYISSDDYAGTNIDDIQN